MERELVYLKNAPIKVFFCGLESNLHKLQNEGWQVAVEMYRMEAYAGRRVTFAFRHSSIKMTMIGNVELSDHLLFNPNTLVNYFQHICINIQYIAPTIQVVQYPMATSQTSDFYPIDCTPTYAKTDKPLNLNDIFQPINKDVELYVLEKDIGELMDIIHKKQAPKQREIREKRRREIITDTSNIDINNSYDIRKDIKLQLVGA